jgi:hypothetical protein
MQSKFSCCRFYSEGMMETAQADERLKGSGAGQSVPSRRGVQIVDDEPQAAAAGGCCSSG